MPAEFVFNPQDFEMRSEDISHVLFAFCLINVGPFCSSSDELHTKSDVELGALSLSLCAD